VRIRPIPATWVRKRIKFQKKTEPKSLRVTETPEEKVVAEKSQDGQGKLSNTGSVK